MEFCKNQERSVLAKLNARLAPIAVEILGFRIGISQLQMHEQLQNFGMLIHESMISISRIRILLSL